jgi:hypothetical protein
MKLKRLKRREKLKVRKLNKMLESKVDLKRPKNLWDSSKIIKGL